MPQTKRKPAKTPPEQIVPPGAITVVKGELTPLTAQQRALVSIFVWYLRSLPPWDDDKSWKSSEYHVVNRLLVRFFLDRNPGWKRTPDGDFNTEDLPEAEGEAIEDLMFYAGSAEDPRIERRQNLVALARRKRFLLELSDRYESDRRELGLPPDPGVRVGRTPLEIAAEQTWGMPNCRAGATRESNEHVPGPGAA